jgi:hypothetical protein
LSSVPESVASLPVWVHTREEGELQSTEQLRRYGAGI